MTDKPRTMMLQPYEWRTLVATGAANIHQYVTALTDGGPPSQEQVLWFHESLDRLKMQVSAWGASGQPAAASSTMEVSGERIASDIAANGAGGGVTAAEPKKKRGWQKGRKRGPRKPKDTEAVQ